MSLKKGLVLTALIIFWGWMAIGGYLWTDSVLAGSVKDIHGGRETEIHVDETHRQKESHWIENHQEVEIHNKTEKHVEESWWRFPGWQIVFAAIGCLYFAIVLVWLPLLVAKEAEGGHH